MAPTILPLLLVGLLGASSPAAGAAAAAASSPRSSTQRRRFIPPVPVGLLGVLPSTANCTVHWITQPLDHYAEFGGLTFQQRYYVYDKWWAGPAQAGPVFFYTGNEVRACVPLHGDCGIARRGSVPERSVLCVPRVHCTAGSPAAGFLTTCCCVQGDVGQYVNATGLMWENAERMGALLVFAEHRYYGASVPADEVVRSSNVWTTARDHHGDLR